MQYLLCPFCFNDVFPSKELQSNTILCSFCNKSYLKELCISDNDTIISIITPELTEEMLRFILNIKSNSTTNSHGINTKIECVYFHLDECLASIAKFSESIITSVGDYNTSIKYRITKKRFKSSSSNVIFVLGRGAGLWHEDYCLYNYLKYTKKVIIIPNNNLSIISDFSARFKLLNNIDGYKKLSIPMALLNTSTLADDSLLILENEWSNCTILPYVKRVEQEKTDYSLLIKWITESY